MQQKQKAENSALKAKYFKWEKDLNERIKSLRNERKEKSMQIAALEEDLKESRVSKNSELKFAVF